VKVSRTCLTLLILCWPSAVVAADALPASGIGPWVSMPPRDCPFPPSQQFSGLSFTGRHAEYTGADTWYPSWAADGNLYSPWTDGNVNGLGISSGGDGATTGQATIVGDDPLRLVVKDASVFRSSPRPYEGRYPCGTLVHNGVWYYGTYCLHPAGGYKHEGKMYNWPWLGPLVGFRWSKDFGKTWTETPCTPARPLLGESALKGEPVKFGAAHFVDFGRNLQHSPDGKAYLVSHGASGNNPKPRYANCSWITGDEIYLARVTPSIETINDPAAYEFFAGKQAGGADAWSRRLADARPIAAWNNNMGCVTATYVPGLKKYIMCVTDGGDTISRFSTYLLESDRVTGPWKLVCYLKDFGVQGYFVNIPSKFISADGRTFWLCYAANFTNGWLHTGFPAIPPGSRYGMCLQEVKLAEAGRLAGAAVRTVANPDEWKPLVERSRCILFVDCPWNEDIAAYRPAFWEFASWCRESSDYLPIRVELDGEARGAMAQIVQGLHKSHGIPPGGLKTLGGAGRVIWMENGRVRDYAWWHEVPGRQELIRRTQVLFSSPPTKVAGDGQAVAAAAPKPAAAEPTSPPARHPVVIDLDVAQAPEMEAWGKATQHILQQWYATVVDALPSEGFQPPKKILFTIRQGKGIAETGGNHIFAAVGWFKAHPDDKGAIVHEMVHVVQAYGGRRVPGWLTEGIADYVRFWIYEPNHPRARVDPQRSRYTDGYQVTGAFLAWLVATYDKDIVVKLNAAARQGRYQDKLFQDYTGKDLDALWKEFVASLPQRRPSGGKG